MGKATISEEKRKHMDVDSTGKRRWVRPMVFSLVVSLLFVVLSLLFLQLFLRMGPSYFTIMSQETNTLGANIGQHDPLLGGLLSPNFENESCIGRYKSSMYWKSSPFPVSSYLISKLRRYEDHHKKCGPNTENYRQAIEQLKSGKNFEYADCHYIIWTNCCGLGNRMLSLTSTFLFSLLTNRVMLLDLTDEMHDLFCEPFPGSSWVLPSDFPIKHIWMFHKDAPESYSYILENKIINNNINMSAHSLPAYIYLSLMNVNFRLVNHMFCENDHKIFQRINWLIVRSDCYYALSLFLMPMYKQELENMFPTKEYVFHILGRYLFRPANPVWELIERYYETYLANIDEQIGLQIRLFPQYNVSFEQMFDRILECSRDTNLLPELGPTNLTNPYNAKKRSAILVVSLLSDYYEKLKSMYYKNSTVTGEMVAIYQPSHEHAERHNEKSHNQQALAEIFLLSYSDKIATTAVSTFGYVSYSLGGLRPWLIRAPIWMPPEYEGACARSESVEPCLHSPPILKCNGNEDLNVTEVFNFVRQCEDVPLSLKMFGN